MAALKVGMIRLLACNDPDHFVQRCALPGVRWCCGDDLDIWWTETTVPPLLEQDVI